jgi:hypothetical protein
MTLVFGCHQQTEEPDNRETESRGGGTSTPLVKQNPIYTHLDRQRDCFCLAGIQLLFQLSDEGGV